jgi:5-methylcytosine-specific restriction endonuclease McrA
MDAALERLVRRRANGRCEYCRLPQFASDVPFGIDHIIARKHKGRNAASNLAFACFYCNGYKGPCIAGREPLTSKLTPFYTRKVIQIGKVDLENAVA